MFSFVKISQKYEDVNIIRTTCTPHVFHNSITVHSQLIIYMSDAEYKKRRVHRRILKTATNYT